MSFPLDLRAFGCTALLPSAATPYGCIFRTTARHERAPVRVLTRSVSDVGRSPVPIPWCILLPQAHQTRRAAVHHSSRPVASGCGKLCRYRTALTCRCAGRTEVRRLAPTLFHGRASTCRTASEAGPTPLPCRGPFRAGRLPLLVAAAPPDERQRVLDGHRPACPSWTHQKRSFPGKHEASLDPTGAPASQRQRAARVSHQGSFLERLTGSYLWTPTAREPLQEAELCPFAPCGALLPGSPFPSTLLAAPGRVGDATGATTAAPPCSDSSSACSRTA